MLLFITVVTMQNANFTLLWDIRIAILDYSQLHWQEIRKWLIWAVLTSILECYIPFQERQILPLGKISTLLAAQNIEYIYSMFCVKYSAFLQFIRNFPSFYDMKKAL